MAYMTNVLALSLLFCVGASAIHHEVFTSGEGSAAAGGRKLLTCVPSTLTWSACLAPSTLPSGAACTSCSNGYKTRSGRNGNQGCAVYTSCTYVPPVVVTSASGSTNPQATGTATQTTGVSTGGASSISISGSGSASSSTSSSASVTAHIDGGAFSSAFVTALQAYCNGGDVTGTLNVALKAYVNACVTAKLSCQQRVTSTGGGSTSSNCFSEVTAFQGAATQALVDAIAAYLETANLAGTQCSLLTAGTNGAPTVNAQLANALIAGVWTTVSTATGTGSAYAVADQDIASYTSAFADFCTSIIVKSCTCQPTCAYCAAHPANPCTGSSCPCTGANCPGTGSGSTTNNAGGSIFPYSTYQGTIISLFDTTTGTALNSGCGNKVDASIWANAFSKAVAYITDDVYAHVSSSGTGLATASYSVDSTGYAYTSILTDFVASATATGCVLPSCNPDCTTTAYTALEQAFQAEGWAQFCLQKCGFVTTAGGPVTIDRSYTRSTQGEFANAILDPSSPYANILTAFIAQVSSNCACGNAYVVTGTSP